MVGSDGGEDAYRIQDKTTTTTLSSSSSSLVSLRRALATSLTVTGSCSSVESFVALGPWARRSLSFVGVGYAVVRGRGSFNSRCWWFSGLLGVRCRSLGAGRRLPLAVFFACGCRLGGCRRLGGWVVCGGGCVTWQRATWRAQALSLTLVTWACGCRVSLAGGCRGSWARDVRRDGCYEWGTWWQAVVEVVVVG